MRNLLRYILTATALAAGLPGAAHAAAGNLAPADLSLLTDPWITSREASAQPRLAPIRIPDLPVRLSGGLDLPSAAENGGWSAILQGFFSGGSYDLSSTLTLSPDRGESSVSLGCQPQGGGFTLGALYLADRPADTDTGPSAGGPPLFLLPKTGAQMFGAAGDAIAMRKLGIFGDWEMNPRVGIRWGLGYASVRDGKAGLKAGAWQYNVGVGYKVLDHLLYEAHFGYLDADDTAKADAAAQAPSIQDVYVIGNNITMTF